MLTSFCEEGEGKPTQKTKISHDDSTLFTSSCDTRVISSRPPTTCPNCSELCLSGPNKGRLLSVQADKEC